MVAVRVMFLGEDSGAACCGFMGKDTACSEQRFCVNIPRTGEPGKFCPIRGDVVVIGGGQVWELYGENTGDCCEFCSTF